jgi:predicted secreted hydrolase
MSRNNRVQAAYGRPQVSRWHRNGPFKFFAKVAFLVTVLLGSAALYFWTFEAESPVAALGESAEQAAPKSRERTAALPPLRLPADDAPHASAMEWWYYSGILDGRDGGRYAFHAAVFVANGLIKHTVMHAALTDLQTGKRYTAQSRTGGVPAQHIADGFDFKQDSWQISASGDSQEVRTRLDGASLALTMNNSGQLLAHRAAGSETPGLLDFGAAGISYYYSRPRLAAKGEISIGGKPVAVSGNVWFDHQWGEFDVLGLGWNWFALHLADGSDVMLYELFDSEGKKVMTAGTVTNSDGAVALQPNEVQLTPVGTWTSPGTKIKYPVEWNLKMPSGVLNIKPYVAESEFDASASSSNIYWEGPVKITGGATGQGFMELSGYDRLAAVQGKAK